MAAKDYYEILGVSPDASQEAIRKVYRRLAKKHHPDRQGGSKAAEEKFKEIADAYGVLGDPEKRKQYDRLRQAGMHGGAFEGLGGLEDLFSRAGADTWRDGDGVSFGDLGSLSDLFGKIFGGGRRRTERTARQRGRDLTSSITITFETAVRGGKAEVRLSRDKTCASCAGTGAAPSSRVDTCPQCGGTGQVLSGQGAFSVARPCPSCFGRGRIMQTPCGRCRGTGSVQEPSTIEVKIPPGIEDRQKIRLASLGQPGVGGGRPGDLLLEVHVQPHARFERKGRDIHSKVHVNMVEAALGTKVDVQTMQGRVTVTVPPGTQPDQKLRIPGYGLQTSDRRKGDHYVEIQVSIPRDLTEEQKRLLEQLRRAPAVAKQQS